MLNESIIKIRVELQKGGLKQTGKNKEQGFTYFKLDDFLPTINKLMLEEKINDILTVEYNKDSGDYEYVLYLVKGEEKNRYAMPYREFEVPKTKNGYNMMQPVQYVGAIKSYYRRYLYLDAFGITEVEIIDSMNVDELSAKDQHSLSIKKELPQKLKLECPDENKLRTATNLTLGHFKFRNWKELSFDQITEQEFINVFIEKVASL